MTEEVEISVSYSGRCEEDCLLGCALYYDSSLLMFQRWLLQSCITLMVMAASTSETWGSFYQTTWCNNPEDSHFHNKDSLGKEVILGVGLCNIILE
jgi:hypothetical protein